MKLKTLFTMDYGWARHYLWVRLNQRVEFMFAHGTSYSGVVHRIPLTLSFSTPYHHARAYDMTHGAWDELPLLKDWMEYARGADLIFDVGGYNGIYGILAAKANPHAHVLIFEPDPVNAEHIRTNIALNNVHAQVVEMAISDYQGFIRFSGDGSTGSKVASWGTEIPCGKLSQFGSPELLKVDVEGHELEVLKGADLTNTKILFAEVNHPLPYKEIKRVGITAIFAL